MDTQTIIILTIAALSLIALICTVVFCCCNKETFINKEEYCNADSCNNIMNDWINNKYWAFSDTAKSFGECKDCDSRWFTAPFRTSNDGKNWKDNKDRNSAYISVKLNKCDTNKCNNIMSDWINNKYWAFSDSAKSFGECSGCESRWFTAPFKTSNDGKNWKDNKDRNSAYVSVRLTPPPVTTLTPVMLPTTMRPTTTTMAPTTTPPPIPYYLDNNKNYRIKSGFVLDDLPLNRYPFVGAHDCATGSGTDLWETITDLLPFTKTQTRNFYDMYNSCGINFFDIRCTYGFSLKYGSDQLRFQHGPIPLQFAKADTNLEKMVVQTVKDKKLTVLYITAEKDGGEMTKILELWESYLSDKGLKNNYYKITSLEQLNNMSIKSFKDKNQYLIIVPKNFVNDNWQWDNTCFDKLSASSILDGCRSVSCLGKDSSQWKVMYDYIDTSYRNYISNRDGIITENQIQVKIKDLKEDKDFKLDPPTYANYRSKAIEMLNNDLSKLQNGMTMIQTMWQSAVPDKGLAAALACAIDGGIGGQAITQTNQSFINSKLYKYFSNKKYTPNILLFDDVNECTKAIFDCLVLNFTNPGASRPTECSSVGKPGDQCSRNINCENDWCGRPGTDGNLKCCKNGLWTAAGGIGKDYCKEEIDDQNDCYYDVQCKTGYCGGNAYGATTGVCGKNLDSGARCKMDSQCKSGNCKGNLAGTVVGRCTSIVGDGNDCRYDSECTSGNCAGNGSGTINGVCGANNSLSNGTRCKMDYQCRSGNCKGNAYGVTTGTCADKPSSWWPW